MNAITKAEKMSPAELFSGDSIEKILVEIKEEVLSFVPDTTTEKGKKEIKSIANKVARSKTFLDGTGKQLADELNAQLKPINSIRKNVRDTLDELKAEVRKPLTIIENIEKERVEKLQERLAVFDTEGLLDDSAKRIEQTIKEIEAIVIDSTWQEFECKAGAMKVSLLETLNTRLQERRVFEAEQAKLEAEKQEQLRIKIRKEEEEKARLKFQREEQQIQQEEDRKKSQSQLVQNAEKRRERIESELVNDLMIALFCSEEFAKSLINEINSGKLRHLRIDY